MKDGFRLFEFETLDSTNTYLKRQIRECCGNDLQDHSCKCDIMEYDTVSTKYQTSGRGRRGNKWEATSGAGLFSFIVELMESNADEKKLPLVVGLSVMVAIKNVINLKANELIVNDLIKKCIANIKFKWTNDVYYKDKKLSGVMIERVDRIAPIEQSSKGSRGYYVIGVGININNKHSGEMKDIATSIKNIIKDTVGVSADIEINDVITEVIKQFKRYNSLLLNGGWNKILSEIDANNYLKGRDVVIELLNGDTTGRGRVVGIDTDGKLEVMDGTKIKRYDIGQVHLSKK